MKSNKIKIIKDLFIPSWKVYKKNWFNFILIGLVFMLIAILMNSISSAIYLNNNAGDVMYYHTSPIMSLISWLASTYIGIGVIRYMLNLIDGKKAKLKSIFYGVDSIGHFAFVILVGIVSGLIVLFGTLLFIIPGIIAGLGLYFSKYIIIENKGGDVEVMEAIKKSWEITKGHRWKILWVSIVLFFFNIIGLAALIIGLVITIPVSSLMILKLYRKLDTLYTHKKTKEERKAKEN